MPIMTKSEKNTDLILHLEKLLYTFYSLFIFYYTSCKDYITCGRIAIAASLLRRDIMRGEIYERVVARE